MLKSCRFLPIIVGFVPFVLAAAACSDDTPDPNGGAGGDSNSGGASDSGGDSAAMGGIGVAGDGGLAGAGNGTPDTTAPTVLSNQPSDEGNDEPTGAEVTAVFSEAMSASTLTDVTFTLEHDAETVPGTVSYWGDTVSFLPDEELKLDTTYTATVTTDATDVAGNALEADHVWSFTTTDVARRGPAPVLLGAAGKYVILAKSAISNVPISDVTGDLGLSPAAASYITGFSLTRVGVYWTSSQVTGRIFAANNDPPSPSNLTTAVGNMQSAYTDAAGRPTPDFLELEAGSIGGLTLSPGLYKWTSNVKIPTNITLAGSANDVWIFQISGNLELSAAKRIALSGGARAKNIFWQVAGAVDLGANAHAEGIVLAKTRIGLGTGASINGRLLAQTAVNIAGSTISEPVL